MSGVVSVPRSVSIATLVTTSLLTFGVSSSAEAKSCSDVLATCLKMYAVTRGHQGAADPETTCRNDYNGCMATGTWAGTTTTIKGLEKK